MTGNMCWIGGKHTGFPDNLTLLLRLSYALEATQKQFSSVNNRQVNAEMLQKRLLDLLAFVKPHHSCRKHVSTSDLKFKTPYLPLSTKMAWKRSPRYKSASQTCQGKPYDHTNCFLHELSCNSRIHAPRNPANDLCVIANKFSDANNFLVQEIFHHPAGLRPTDVNGKVMQDFTATRRL